MSPAPNKTLAANFLLSVHISSTSWTEHSSNQGYEKAQNADKWTGGLAFREYENIENVKQKFCRVASSTDFYDSQQIERERVVTPILSAIIYGMRLMMKMKYKAESMPEPSGSTYITNATSSEWWNFPPTSTWQYRQWVDFDRAVEHNCASKFLDQLAGDYSDFLPLIDIGDIAPEGPNLLLGIFILSPAARSI
ncbi:hypothetical protein FQN54_009971 [Arachnomyces sp. PD_36]|nr:hypothetical protein FQN54_009971 [Arachnomyces sp. PD_36]